MSALDEAMKDVNLPWRIDQDNDKGLCVMDARGDIVYAEDWGSIPDEMNSATSERIIMQARANAFFMVAASALEEMQQANLEHLCAWVLKLGLSTGHADTVQDLLGEVEWQIKEMRQRTKEMQQERQALIDAATERAAHQCYTLAMLDMDENPPWESVAQLCGERIEALIGQPLPESGKEGEV